MEEQAVVVTVINPSQIAPQRVSGLTVSTRARIITSVTSDVFGLR